MSSVGIWEMFGNSAHVDGGSILFCYLQRLTQPFKLIFNNSSAKRRDGSDFGNVVFDQLSNYHMWVSGVRDVMEPTQQFFWVFFKAYCSEPVTQLCVRYSQIPPLYILPTGRHRTVQEWTAKHYFSPIVQIIGYTSSYYILLS